MAYFLLARLGQILAIEPGNVTPIWPASGFALTIVLRRGYRTWLGLWVGVFFGNAWAFWDPSTFQDALRTSAVGLAIGPGAILQAFLGAYLIRRFCTNGEPFGRIRDVFCFVGAQAFACLSSATFGVSALCLGSIVPWASFGYTWTTWYLGDGIGIILVAPLLLTWPMALPLIGDAIKAAEAVTILILSVLASLLAFSGVFQPSLIFLPLPLILWAAVRGDQFAVSSTVLGVWIVALWGTLQGLGSFVTEDINVSLLLLQLYAAITLVTGSAVTSALTERKRTERLLRETNRELSAAEEDLRLAAVAFQAHDSIVITDTGGKILRVNQSFTELTGYQPDDVIGKTPNILRSGRHDDGFYREMWESIRNTGHWDGEVWNKRKDGHIYLQRLTITCVKNESGETTHYVADGQDITEAKQAAADRAAINAARKVQESLFPPESPSVPAFDMAGAVHPAEHASGDYFDFVSLGDGSLGILVADVSSHGLGPALLMAQVQAYTRALANSHDDPAVLLTHLNQLFASNRSGHIVTLFLGCLDVERRSFAYASAGHQAYVIGGDGALKVLKATGVPLGVDANLTFCCASAIALEPGDVIVLPTDGIEETQGPDGRLFGRERMFDVVRANREKPAAEIVEILFRTAREFDEGTPQKDDITAVVVKMLPPK
jgi:PAS domain S-box-containing protein